MEASIPEMTGIILCGGQSSRMGCSKALMEYKGVRLIERITCVLKGLFKEIVLVTNRPGDYYGLDVEIVTDLIPGKGAIGGLYTGLF